MRHYGVAALVVVVVMGAGGGTLASGRTQPAAVADSSARVRSDIPDVRRLVAGGLWRSTTFRRLVDTIGQTDGIVYIAQQSCGPRGVRACLSMSMTLAGPHRILFVRLGPEAREDVAIASLGHELQHAIEVLSEPGVRSGDAMYFLFKRIGSWVQYESFETGAAVRAGDAILVELRKTRAD